MDLRQAGDDLLAGLRVAVQVDRRILLLQAAQRGEDLVLVALRLRFDRERHDGGGEPLGGHPYGLVAGGQPVPGTRVLELGHAADVARAEGIGGGGPLAGEDDQLADALLGWARVLASWES